MIKKQLNSQKLTNGNVEVLEQLHGAQREGVMCGRLTTLAPITVTACGSWESSDSSSQGSR